MIDARLQEGPFDGVEESIPDVAEPPKMVGAYRCPECGDVHIASYFEIATMVKEAGLELVRYMLVKSSDQGALYRYSDANRGPDLTEEEPVFEDVPEPQTRPELVPV